MSRSNKYLALAAAWFLLLAAKQAQAVCPVCTVAVGACVGLSRWLGVDDTIAGVWIGGMISSLSLWTLAWMRAKNYAFRYQRTIVFLGYLAIVVAPLYFYGIAGHPYNRLWGVDKLVLGIASGLVGLLLGGNLHAYAKKKNAGRSYFPFQKVALAILPLAVLSAIFYFFTC